MRKRSASQNRYFHALIEAAFDNQRGGPSLPSWRHLKGWLLIQAGHCNTIQFDARAMNPDVARALRQQFDCVDFTTDGRRILMKVARSVSFNKANAEEMGALVDRIVNIICTEVVPGVDPETLLNMAKRAA